MTRSYRMFLRNSLSILFLELKRWETNHSARNNFSLFTGHMSFQAFLLVGHFKNWTGHNLLTDNTLKKITQDVLVRCSVIVSDHNTKLAGQFQNLVGQCLLTNCYFQHWIIIERLASKEMVLLHWWGSETLKFGIKLVDQGQFLLWSNNKADAWNVRFVISSQWKFHLDQLVWFDTKF